MDADDGDGCGKAMLDVAVSTSHMSWLEYKSHKFKSAINLQILN